MHVTTLCLYATHHVCLPCRGSCGSSVSSQSTSSMEAQCQFKRGSATTITSPMPRPHSVLVLISNCHGLVRNMLQCLPSLCL